MKKLLGLIGSSCAITFSPFVQAQANVTDIERKTTTQRAITFYGVVDAGVTLVNNEAGQRNIKLDTGIMDPNYWGIKGKEDLGGGRKAIFQLENSFHLHDGKLASVGTLFDRIAIVGLVSEYGQISVGTQRDLINDYVTPFNVSAAASGYAAHQGNFDRIAGNSVQRSIKMTSPDFNGFTFGALYSFADKNQPSNEGEIVGGSGSILNIGGHYNSGPFAIGASYMRLNTPRNDEAISPYPSLGRSYFLKQSTFEIDPETGERTPIGQMAIDSQQIFAVGSSYEMGDFTALTNFVSVKFKGYGNTATLRLIEVGGVYKITNALDGTLGFQRMHFEGIKANQISAGLNYHLSKRSDLYVSADYRKSSRGDNGVVGESFAPSSNSAQALMRIGMRHTF